MASIISRNGKLYIDFRFNNLRYREATGYMDTPRDSKAASKLVKRIEKEILMGTFDYLSTFPNGNRTTAFQNAKQKIVCALKAIVTQFVSALINTSFHTLVTWPPRRLTNQIFLPFACS
jgi:hypothetical protein